MENTESFHISDGTKMAVLNELIKYLRPDQIGIVRPGAFGNIVTRPHGPNTRVFFSRRYAGIPDLEIPTPLWWRWCQLAQDCEPDDTVFSRHELEVAKRSYGIALSDLEPHKRFYGYQDGAMELWGGVSQFADLIDAKCADEIANCRSGADKGFWEENFVTGFVLERLQRDLGHVLTMRSGKQIFFQFAGYKRKAGEEKAHGDVTFIVVRDDDDEAKFTGIGYIEMKRRDKRGGLSTFDELQLHKILRHSPNALVGIQEWQSGRYQDCVHVGPEDGRIAILPITQVIDEFDHINALCRFSTTLGHQIAVRYLNGADLVLDPILAPITLESIKSEYIAMLGVGQQRTLERLLDQPGIKRKLEHFEDIRVAMERLRESGRTR